jgi:hypothetical protein
LRLRRCRVGLVRDFFFDVGRDVLNGFAASLDVFADALDGVAGSQRRDERDGEKCSYDFLHEFNLLLGLFS